MSAQSSARSKRRQSALFSSKSLLPLPQISISSIATSTPARGSQRQLPAPLPTPGPSQTHLLGTPARKQDDNTTFFGFSPGTEANETALLAVDYRSIGFEDVGRNEQLEADTFDDTAILEQRAFADRRISNEGDQSLGGLGALIFSNLIAGNQPQEALERLELGKRRDGSTSRRSITLSPAKRNASFTLSTGGEYLVDYETDVRFGDDLQDLFDEAAEYATNKEKIFLDAVLPPVTFGSSPIPRLYPPSSPHVANDYPNRTAQSRQEGILAADSLDHQQYTSSPVQHKFYTNTCERSSPTACAEIRLPGKDEPAYTAQALPPLGSSHGYIDPSPAISSASVHPTVPVSDEPSQAMAEKRLARRQRRGLTASMAVLLSPVAEDRDREKSLSRSRSMLREALEDPYLGDPAKEAGHPSVSHVQDHEDHAPESTHDKDAHFHPQEVVTQIQAASIWKGEPDDECHADQSPFPPTGTDTISPVPLACILAASLPDVGRSANLSPASSIFTRPTASEPHPLITDEGQALAMTSLAKSTVKQQKASGAAGSNLKRTAESVGRQNRAAPRDGPSYLKPTLRRSIQQRETVPLRRSVSLSKAKPAVKGAPVRRTASHTMVDHASRPLQPATGRKAQGSVSDRELVTSTSADTTAPRVAIALSKKNSVDDLFERRQRDGGKASSRAREKGKGKELVEHQKFKRPETNQAALPETSSQEPKDRLDAGLTLPRGFSFAQSRPARKPASEDRTGRGEAALHGERAAGRSAVIRPHAVAMRKARRVLPAVNERLDGSDPEIGPCVPLTTAALAAQENALDVSYQAMEGGREPTAGLSESFERTSQSQMLQRYLRELAAMEVEEPARATASEPFLHTSASKALSTASEARHLKHSRQTVALPTTVVTERSPKRPRLEDRSKSKSVDDRQTRPQETRLPLGCISTAMTNAICKPPTSSSTMKRVNAKRIEESKSQAPTVPCVPARPAPKVKDFTFQIVGQQQISFQERLAAWQAREAEAAKLGKPMLQPLVLPARDPAKEARKADKPAVSRPKRPTQAKEFSWHSDKRAKERKDWEDRLREKEQILAELAEIKRLEAEAAELEAIRKMRAAQVPIAHPVPAFIRSKRRA